ncbi:MAG: undecaprenyl-diphosphate phosphatase [Holosporales bacterium]|jgi:undecaprenyl-diphosphatase|nr:undecaprenyl-diphosphate phosphatase [Holosporales bacterium]
MSFEILLLSIVQGIGEILPISSSVNLHLFSKLFHIQDFSFSLKIALHVGSLITLLIYSKKDVINIFKGLFSKKRTLFETYFFPLLLGTIPVTILGYFSRDFVKEFDSPKIMGTSSVLFGLTLFVFDKLSCAKNRVEKDNIQIWKACFIGCFQSLALFPGVSRLGICITASRMLNLDRRKAIRFSLLLAIPSILGSLSLETFECCKTNDFSLFSGNTAVSVMIVAITGLITIWPAIRFMEKKGFLAITIYRIVVGSILCFL